jgi:hypothetical protein
MFRRGRRRVRKRGSVSSLSLYKWVRQWASPKKIVPTKTELRAKRLATEVAICSLGKRARSVSGPDPAWLSTGSRG